MLDTLTRKDTTDSPYRATERNIEVACAYAIRMARKFCRKKGAWLDSAEVESYAISAVLRGANRYDPNNATGSSFFTYSYYMANGACLESYRRQLVYKARLTSSPYVDLIADLENSISKYRSGAHVNRKQIWAFMFCSYSLLCEDFENTVLDAITIPDRLAFCKEVLTEQEFKAMMLVAYHKKQSDVGAMMGVTGGRISQLVTSSIKKLAATS